MGEGEGTHPLPPGQKYLMPAERLPVLLQNFVSSKKKHFANYKYKILLITY